MAALKIALIGAHPAHVIGFTSLLDDAIKASDWTSGVKVVSTDSLALPADLASFDLVLLMGMEPVAKTLGFPASGELAQEAADRSIRTALTDAALSYQVLYGTSEQRLDQALHAIQSRLPPARVGPRQSAPSDSAQNRPWVWMCDKCSDPQCEHRLLTALLAQRASTV
jgi:hypothetical protein